MDVVSPARALATLPDADKSTVADHCSDGRVVDIGNVEHTPATQKHTGHRGLGPVLASGVVRWRSDSGDIVFVQLNTPMTAAQLRAVGGLQEKYGELIIDVTHTGPLPRDAAPVFTGRSQDRIATWRVLREANAAAADRRAPARRWAPPRPRGPERCR